METGDHTLIGQVERAYAVFIQLQNNGVHQLATLAVERVSWGLAQLERMKGHKNYGKDQSLELPGLSSAGSHTTGDVEMQDPITVTAESEASTVHGKLAREAVMGNTGMLLLEDPGLQSFVPETFQPFVWNIEKEEWRKSFEASTPGKKEEVVKQCGRSGYARSSEQLQGVTTTAPRFATLGAAPAREQQEHRTSQLQGPPFSTSPQSSFSNSSAGSLHQFPPPHLRQQQAPFSFRRPQHRQTHVENSGSRIESAPEPNRGQSQPFFHAIPEYMTHLTSASNPNVHTSCAARPAGLVPSASHSVRMVTRPRPSFATSPLSQRDLLQTWQYNVPCHVSSTAGGDSIVASAYGDDVKHGGGGRGE